MTTQQLTTRYIFEANQLLTLELAHKLKGKLIACTSPEYRMNTPHLVQFVVGDIVSEWDHAATRVYPDQQGKYTQYDNYQQYWASYMSADKIDELKTTMLVLDNAGNWQYRCNTKYWMYSNTPTFHGSDVDREVYYVELIYSEMYNGYKITYSPQKAKYIARYGRKIFSSNTDLNVLKYGIDAWKRNRELSHVIDRTPEGRSTNPNVIRTYEKD